MWCILERNDASLGHGRISAIYAPTQNRKFKINWVNKYVADGRSGHAGDITISRHATRTPREIVTKISRCQLGTKWMDILQYISKIMANTR